MTNKSKLKIIQWNARSAVANKNSLINFLITEDIDIALISETWFKRDVVYIYRGYNVIREDRDDGYSGVAILIKTGIPFERITIKKNYIQDLLACGIKINYKQSYLSLLSVYRCPKTKTKTEDWDKLFSQLKHPCIIGGDMNAHNSLWGSYKNDNIGHQIVETIQNLDYVVMNNGQPTCQTSPGNSDSMIDVTFCSPSLFDKTSWSVDLDTLGSNHFVIKVVIDVLGTNANTIYPSTKWNIKKANWSLYSQLVDTLLNEKPHTSLNTQEKYNFLIDCINEASKQSISEYKPFKCKRTPPPWWDSECDQSVAERKKALINYKNNSSPENFCKCKEVNARVKKFLKLKAKQSWVAWCSKLNKQTPSSLIWNQARKMNRKKVNFSLPLSNSWVDDFFDKIAPPYVNNQLDVINSKTLPSDQNHFLLTPFSRTELEFALDNRVSTSPGYDAIKYPMIQHLPDNAKQLLLNIFDQIIIEGNSIIDFKRIIVVPIPKPGKDPKLAEAYRPISLLSCILKTLERMVKIRLDWWLRDQNPLPANQHGFKKGYGTLDSLTTLVVDIQNSFSRNSYVPALFLDIEGAYDSVSLSILQEKMITFFNIPSQFASNIVNLYKNRIIYLKNNHTLIGPRLNNKGLPQGSVLSPILFNIYTADLHNITINNIAFNVVQYADDFCLYTEHKKYQQSIENLNSVYGLHKKWFIENGFELSCSKSQVCLFTRHNFPNISTITLGGHKFSFKNKIKYLGMILDQKLTWKLHIDDMLNRCNKGINFLKSINRTWWGSDVEVSLLFYKAYIRSIFDYGSVLYGSASNALLNKINVLQNSALRICLGAMRSTPVQALYLEALEPPLNLRRSFLSKKYLMKVYLINPLLYQKIVTLSCHDLTNKYWQKKKSPLLCEAYNQNIVLLKNIDKTNDLFKNYAYSSFFSPTDIIVPNYSENIYLNKNILLSITNSYNESIALYTDASKSADGTGCAFFIPSGHIEKKFKLKPETSIYTAEAIAIYEALLYVAEFDFAHIIILSDSLAVLKSLGKYGPPNIQDCPYIYKIKHIKQNLLTKGINVHFIWIKAHAGFEHNEYVDLLAKESVSSDTSILHKITLTDSIISFKSTLHREWSYQWKEYSFVNQNRYSLIQPDIPKFPWYKSCRASRKYITSIIRVRFGHACYPKHLFKIQVLDNDKCEHCEEESDLDHIFFGCSKNTIYSSKLINDLLKCKVATPWNILYLLSLGSVDVYNSLINFLKDSKLSL